MPAKHSTGDQQRWFLSAIQNPTEDRCIEWPFLLVDNDHALIRWDGRKQLAHRLAHFLHYGQYPMPQGIRVCGNLRCINPLHVKAMDKWENGAYRASKQNTAWRWMEEQIKTRTDIEACWDWPYCTNRIGQYSYGSVTIPLMVEPDRKQRIVGAHRAAFFLLHGRWPVGDALHNCDRPICFNPHHLRDGSHTDNMRDMKAKGRHYAPKGESCAFHKLNEKIVRRMQKLHSTEQVSIAKIAKMFKVGRGCVHAVVSRKSWKHVR